MGYAKHVGRVGALAVALGVGIGVAGPPSIARADETTASPSSTPADSPPTDTGSDEAHTSLRATRNESDDTGDTEDPPSSEEVHSDETATEPGDVEAAPEHEAESLRDGDEHATPAKKKGRVRSIDLRPRRAADATPPPTAGSPRPHDEITDAAPTEQRPEQPSTPSAGENASVVVALARSAPTAAEAPVAEAPREVATRALRSPIWAPLLGLGGSDAPIESPALWVLLAAARRQYGRTRTESGARPGDVVALSELAAGNTQPTAAPTVGTPSSSGRVTGKVNATDPDGDRLTYRASSTPRGAVSVTSSGAFTYTPTAAARYAASASDGLKTDTFAITVDDGTGNVVSVPITVAIRPANSAPSSARAKVENPDPVAGTVRGTLTASDRDKDLFSYTATTPGKGTVTIAPDGSFTYHPTAAARDAARSNGKPGTDAFKVTVDDGHGGVAVVSVSVKIAPRNTAPVGGTPTAGTPSTSTGAVKGSVSATDPENDSLTYGGSGKTTYGKVSVSSKGSFTYTPTAAARHAAAAPNGITTDTFTVAVTDKFGAASTMSVTVTISPKNTAPRARVTVAKPNTTTGVVTGTVTATDSDRDTLTFSAPADTGRGTVAVDANGKFTYTPTEAARRAAGAANAPAGAKTDAFVVTITDGHGGTTAVSVPVSIAPKTGGPTNGNTAPTNVRLAGVQTNTVNGVVTGTIVADDADGDTLSYSTLVNTTRGTLTVAANGSFTYTPRLVERLRAGAAEGADLDAFYVSVTDGVSTPSFAVLAVTISAARYAATDVINVGRPVNEADGPTTIGYANGRGFVANTSAGTVQAFDLATGNPVGAPITVANPQGVLGVGNVVYVAAGSNRALVKISPTTLASTGSIQLVDNSGGPLNGLSGNPDQIAAFGSQLVVTSRDASAIFVVNPTATPTVRAIPIPKPSGAVSVSGGVAYVVASNSLYAVDLSSGHVDTIAVGPRAIDIAAAGNRQYVANFAGDSVSVIEAGVVIDEIPVADAPFSVTANQEGTLVVVTSVLADAGPRDGGVATVIDVETSAVLGTFTVPQGAFLSRFGPDGQIYISSVMTDDVYVVSLVPQNDLPRGEKTSTIHTSGLPVAVAFSPDGSRAYVTNTADAVGHTGNTIAVINTATNTIIGTPITVGNAPGAIAVNPNGTRVYVANGDGTVSVINTTTNSVQSITVSSSLGGGIAVSPDGNRVYVADAVHDAVAVINTATNTVTTIAAGDAPSDVAVSRNGSILYVTNAGTKSISVIDLAHGNAVSTILIPGLPPGAAPVGMAISPDGSTIYVTAPGSFQLVVIDTATKAVKATVPLGSIAPFDVAFSPDGSFALVTGSGGSVSVIDTKTHTLADLIAVGPGSTAVAFHPSDPTTAYVTTLVPDKLERVGVRVITLTPPSSLSSMVSFASSTMPASASLMAESGALPGTLGAFIDAVVRDTGGFAFADGIGYTTNTQSIPGIPGGYTQTYVAERQWWDYPNMDVYVFTTLSGPRGGSLYIDPIAKIEYLPLNETITGEVGYYGTFGRSMWVVALPKGYFPIEFDDPRDPNDPVNPQPPHPPAPGDPNDPNDPNPDDPDDPNSTLEERWEAFTTITGGLPYVGTPIDVISAGVDGVQLVSAIFHGDIDDIADESGDLAGDFIGILVGKKVGDAVGDGVGSLVGSIAGSLSGNGLNKISKWLS